MFPIRSAITDVPARTAQQVRLAILVDIGKPRGFVVDNIEDIMALPMSVAALWIFEPGRIFAWKTVHQNIGPAVAVEIIGEDEEVFGVGIVDSKSALKAGDRLFGAISTLS